MHEIYCHVFLNRMPFVIREASLFIPSSIFSRDCTHEMHHILFTSGKRENPWLFADSHQRNIADYHRLREKQGYARWSSALCCRWCYFDEVMDFEAMDFEAMERRLNLISSALRRVSLNPWGSVVFGARESGECFLAPTLNPRAP